MNASRMTRLIVRLRWPILAFWLVAAVLSVWLLPQLSTVVAQQDAITLPKSASYQRATSLVARIDPGHPQKSSMIVAIVRKGGLTPADQRFFHARLAALATQTSPHGLSFVQDRWSVASGASSAFLSRDGTTEIAVIGFRESDVNPATAAALAQVESAFGGKPAGLRVYDTGDVPIMQDNIRISQQGVNRTAAVTVVLVLLILVLVLRSALAPLVNLFTIGVSFLITSGVDAYLGRFGLPLTTFTQTFLIAVLFGAGTDYAIILLNRFREELQRGPDGVAEAIARTYAGAGRTVLFSSLTVLVSFATLYFAEFSLYRSGTGVAIGIAITLLACLTLIPALMAIFGRRLFWPRPPRLGEEARPLRLWEFSGRVSTAHPWWTVLALAAVLVPVALLYTGQRSFDTLHQIPQAASVQGFHAVASSFGEGKAMPAEIVIETPADLRSPKGLATVEQVSQALAAQAGVSSVTSATRPLGKPIADFTLADQTGKLASGLAPAAQGAKELQTQLGRASAGVVAASGATSRLQAAAQQLVAGLPSLRQGLLGYAQGAARVGSGADRLTAGARKLAAGANQLATAAQSVAGGTRQLATGLGQAATAGQSVSQGATALSQAEAQMSVAAQSLSQAIAAWAADHPGTGQSPDWQAIAQTASGLDQGLQQAKSSADGLAQGAAGVSQALGTLAGTSTELAHGAAGLAQGTTATAQGARSLATGAAQVGQGLDRLAASAPALGAGASRFATAGAAIANGLSRATAGALALAPGLSSAASAAGQLGDGVSRAQGALAGMSQGAASPGFYVPRSALRSASLQSAMQSFISPDGHVALFTVALRWNPYSARAIAAMPGLVSAARHALATSPLPQGTVYAGGQTGLQENLSALSAHDFQQTALLVLAAIFLLLVILLRSLVIPAYLIASLYATYCAAMGLGQLLFVDVLHHAGLYWVLPFFVFLLLVALGVDYAIFLMTRFEEILRERMTPGAAIRLAMHRMGHVILSAAVIMGGTFGSMAVSGVTSLTELGVVVVIGLFVYTLVLLGFFVPAATAIVGWGLRWPLPSPRPRALRPRHRYAGRPRRLAKPAPSGD